MAAVCRRGAQRVAVLLVEAAALRNYLRAAPMPDEVLVAWGGNAYGQLGVGDTSDRLKAVRLETLPSSSALSSVVCGDYHTAVLTSEGELLTFGSGEHGQLGHGDGDGHCAAPRPVGGALLGARVCAVACGARHTLALTTAGTAFAWGCGTFGALGLGVEVADEQPRPRPLPEFAAAGVAALAAGVYHSAALGADGRVYTWGWARQGQLGDGTEGSHSFAPAEVAALAPDDDDDDDLAITMPSLMPAATALSPAARRGAVRVVRLVSGAHHLFVLNADGDALCWGANSDGQLGLGDAANRPTPTPLDAAAFGGGEFECRLVEVACGERHTAARTRDGAVYCWGDGCPAVSNGSPNHTPSPLPALSVGGATVVQIACGFSHVAALTADGDVLWWEEGALRRPRPPGRVAALACGGYHSLAIAIADDDTSAPPPPRALTPAGAAATGVTPPSPSLSPTKWADAATAPQAPVSTSPLVPPTPTGARSSPPGASPPEVAAAQLIDGGSPPPPCPPARTSALCRCGDDHPGHF